MADDLFLPGVPAELCRAALAAGDGNELGSGKLVSPESSAALAVNAFGYFLERPERLPALARLEGLDWPAIEVRVECQMRFPWAGGRHPWLDAAVSLPETLIGIESKRFEPFRDSKRADFSDAFEKWDWGEGMRAYDGLRRAIADESIRFRFLDAAQLIKHAYGLVTQARRSGRTAILYYLFDEPTSRAGRPIGSIEHDLHRSEVRLFASGLADAEVRFAAGTYGEWLATWSCSMVEHARALADAFALSSPDPARLPMS